MADLEFEGISLDRHLAVFRSTSNGERVSVPIGAAMSLVAEHFDEVLDATTETDTKTQSSLGSSGEQVYYKKLAGMPRCEHFNVIAQQRRTRNGPLPIIRCGKCNARWEPCK